MWQKKKREKGRENGGENVHIYLDVTLANII